MSLVLEVVCLSCGWPSDNTKFRKYEVIDAFGEFDTDFNDNPRGVNAMNASDYLFSSLLIIGRPPEGTCVV